MYIMASKIKRFSLVCIFAILLYTAAYPVIAQNKTKDTNILINKASLALSNSLSYSQNTHKTKPILTNNFQASLKIVPETTKNLLISYLQEDKNFLLKNYENKLPTIDFEITNPIAYYIAPIKPPILDKNKWDQLVKTRYKDGLIKYIAPGVKHIIIKRYTKAGPIFINILEINPAINPYISIEPALAGITLANTKKISNIVKQNNGIAGINASFFKPTSGVPLGTLIINEELMTGPIYERVTLGIKDNQFRMARISLQGKIITRQGDEIKIDNINQPRMLASYTLLYSGRWGKITPPTPQYGIQIAVKNNKIIEISKNQLNIPESGFVIAGSQKQLGKLKINDPIEILISTDPDWSDIKHAVSGGPYLVKEGQIYIDAKEQKLTSIIGRNPRTAVGYTEDNRLIMVTIDGRQNKSAGVSLYELARLMKNFGCYNAMNLDGGSSTQMFVHDKIVNYPLNKGGSFVSNGLIVKIKSQ
ncbi:MAG: phosphodiester glycosidase family protein [bacterium]